ncbi:hypothetical protein BJ170DRAFT_592179 [Xylariales sp. AK1849]|nr:hypothetical protein BJ170DRAFT_592179 [Xylariales sp. AK1849]
MKEYSTGRTNIFDPYGETTSGVERYRSMIQTDMNCLAADWDNYQQQSATMPKPGRRLHLLRRPLQDPNIGVMDSETFFQQKWRAKGLLRSYHGEHIRERDWERMFSRRLLSVANMDPRYLAEFDGSEKAAGRGSGKDEAPKWNVDGIPPKTITPYMNMAFAPMERRLDIAVFRAMFASSARQARQFCVHGAVKVNGKVMHYPTYKLNPGDMFQVDPDMVLFATGAAKMPASEISKKKVKSKDDQEEASTSEPVESEDAAAEEGQAAEVAALEQDPDTTDKPEAAPADLKPTRGAIKDLMIQAKSVLTEEKLNVGDKRKLRAFLKQSKSLLSKTGRSSSPAAIATELNDLMTELKLTDAEPAEAAGAGDAEDAGLASLTELTAGELKALERRIREEEENPRDPSKPYATPWKPRPYMSPFAFIPRYLEVNQNVCSAVYLRHPVARVGSAEVPTPFPYRVNQLAFNWYLRRR